jgi:DNA-binding transcriptional MerR regulator
VRISEFADRVGVATSTVRYYERVGLLTDPARTGSGYRDYQEDDAARLLFVTRARRMGLSCEQIGALLPVWDGTNCGAARERVSQLIGEKQSEIAGRIIELQQFAAQLDQLHAAMQNSPAPSACRTDLTCCVPESSAPPIMIELTRRSPTGALAAH